MTGKVKWFNSKKDYGFITSEEGEDVFLHCSDIVSDKKGKTLIEKTIVTYDIDTTEKGIKAINVKNVG